MIKYPSDRIKSNVWYRDERRVYHLFGAEAITLHSPVRNETEGGLKSLQEKRCKWILEDVPLIIRRVPIPKYSKFHIGTKNIPEGKGSFEGSILRSC